MSRQVTACSSRRLSSTSSSTSPAHSTHGTGPNRVPASERHPPAWVNARRRPPQRSLAQSTASFIAIGLLPRDDRERLRLCVGRERQWGLGYLPTRARAWNPPPFRAELTPERELVA